MNACFQRRWDFSIRMDMELGLGGILILNNLSGGLAGGGGTSGGMTKLCTSGKDIRLHEKAFAGYETGLAIQWNQLLSLCAFKASIW
jgi:hypothetical protein